EADEAAVVGCALAGQLGADLDLDRAVGEVAGDDGEARAVAAALRGEAQFLLLLGELDRQAVAALPVADLRDDEVGGKRLRPGCASSSAIRCCSRVRGAWNRRHLR